MKNLVPASKKQSLWTTESNWRTVRVKERVRVNDSVWVKDSAEVKKLNFILHFHVILHFNSILHLHSIFPFGLFFAWTVMIRSLSILLHSLMNGLEFLLQAMIIDKICYFVIWNSCILRIKQLVNPPAKSMETGFGVGKFFDKRKLLSYDLSCSSWMCRIAKVFLIELSH